MKKKKIILSIIAVGAVLLLGFSFLSKGENKDNNVTKEIEEGKELAKAKSVEEYVDNVFKMFEKHGPVSEEVWPGYNLKDNNIIIAEVDDKPDEVLRAWNLTTTSKKELTKEEIKNIEVPTLGAFSKVDYDGKQGITIAINKKLLPFISQIDFNYAYDIAVHEMYHFYYDSLESYDEMGDESSSMERYTKFPKEAKPRVYRKMIYDNLVLAYENQEDKDLYLGRAKYWNEKWKFEYKEEYKQAKILDIVEGKARYVEYMMCINHENISKEDKVKSIKSILGNNTEIAESSDSESYELGFAAGVLLDIDKPEWKSTITENPESPLELLLKEVKSIEDTSSNFEEVLRKSEKAIAKNNKKIQSKLKSLDLGEKEKSPLLMIKSELIKGGFTTSDFISYKNNVVTLDFGAIFESNSGNVKLDGISAYLIEEENSIYSIPLTMKYKIEEDRLIIDDGGVTSDIKIKEMKNSDGRLLYIVE